MKSKKRERTIKIRLSTVRSVIKVLDKVDTPAAILLTSCLKDKYIKALEKEVLGK
jgi:hypothetical protein